MTTIGMNFIPYSEGMSEGEKIALVVNLGKDYHWYKQDSYGTWSHKQERESAIHGAGYYQNNFPDTTM